MLGIFIAAVFGYLILFAFMLGLLKYLTVHDINKIPMGYRFSIIIAFTLLIFLGVVLIYFTSLDIIGVAMSLIGVYMILLTIFSNYVKKISIAFGSFLILAAVVSILIFRNDSQKVL